MISDIDVLQLFFLTGSVRLTSVGFDIPSAIRVLQGHTVAARLIGGVAPVQRNGDDLLLR